MRRIRLRSFTLIVLAGCLLAGGWFGMPLAHAQATSGTAFSLTTSPIFATLTTTPGGQISTPLKVQNNAQHAVTLNVKLMKFRAYGGSGDAELLNPDGNDPSLKWVSFSATTIVAQPGAWNTVTMTIRPDRTAAFGYYYAVVFTQAGSAASQLPQHANTVAGSSAVLVLVDVQVPGEKRQLAVTGFKPQHNVVEFLPATFDIAVKNTGDVYGSATGDVYVSRSRSSKNTLAVIPVNQGQGNVLPGSSRTFTAVWGDGFPARVVKRVGGQIVTAKNGQPETQLSWDASKLNKLRFGHYYAHLLLVYNNGKQDVPIEAETSFWVIPWRPLLALLVLLALVLFGLVTVLRRGVRLGRKVAAHAKKQPKSKPEA